MSDQLRYVLAVLSHGEPESPTAEATLRSFVEHVTPLPMMTVYHHDGPGVAYCGEPPGPKWYDSRAEQEGFCVATGRLWRKAIQAADLTRAHHVFWLEHDFTFHTHVDLRQLAMIMQSHRRIFQVALMRQAVNPAERKAGGVVACKPDAFTHVVDMRGPVEYLTHREYFTTNPSLLGVELMVQNPWPYDGRECEGRYGIELVGKGYGFAVWGDGRPWVEHTGTRSGKGY